MSPTLRYNFLQLACEANIWDLFPSYKRKYKRKTFMDSCKKRAHKLQWFWSPGILAARYPCKSNFCSTRFSKPKTTAAAYAQAVSVAPPALPQSAGVQSSYLELSDSCSRMLCLKINKIPTRSRFCSFDINNSFLCFCLVTWQFSSE